MAVEVWNERAPVVGEKGELVCTQPFSSCALGSGTTREEKYPGAYFERFPGVWTHGDFAEDTAHGGYRDPRSLATPC